MPESSIIYKVYITSNVNLFQLSRNLKPVLSQKLLFKFPQKYLICSALNTSWWALYTRQLSAALRARAFYMCCRISLSLSVIYHQHTHTLTHIQVSIITHQSRACLEPGRTKMALRRSNQSKIILRSRHQQAHCINLRIPQQQPGINNNHNKKTTTRKREERDEAHTLVVVCMQ